MFLSRFFNTENKKQGWHICLLVLAIVLAYSKIYHAGFIAWDDKEYILDNKDVKMLSTSTLSAWFSHFYVGNYNPLTIATYAVDYAVGRAHPLMYHLTNVLLHICTSVILYFLINRLQPKQAVGFLVALIFALHPVQTESVSWIAERKTILSALFYLLALLQYTRYLEKQSFRNIAVVILFGLAAMLSKAVAVVIPLSLLVLDLSANRSLKNKKVWLEKVPLFTVAIIIGIVAIRAQESGKFLGLHAENSWLKTVLFAAYAYAQYIIHLVLPAKLSVIYPYPNGVTFIQYLFLMISIGLLALVIVSYRRKKYVLFQGIALYTLNIFFLLQFIQFGEVLMADRYLYVAGIWIIFPAVYYLFIWLEHKSKELVAVIGISAIALTFSIMTFVRNAIWLSDYNFFSAIVDTYPNSAVAQYSIGVEYMRMGNYTEAEKHMEKAVQLDPGNFKAWYDKGTLHLHKHQPAECLDALNKCLSIKEYPKAYLTRAIVYQSTGRQELALADIEKVLAQEPQNAKAWFIKAGCLEQLGQGNEAIRLYSKAILYDSTDPALFIRRGLLYARTMQNEAALSDLNTAVEQNPDNGEALYFRGIVKFHIGQNPCDDFMQALNHGYKQASDAIAKVCGH